MSERTARVDELLREEISRVLARDVHDPRIGFVTVTSVEVSPDLRHATVWVSLIGQRDERREAMAALGRAMPFVRHQLGSLRLRRIPELHLRADDTVERGTRVLSILREIAEGGEPAPPEPVETLPTPTGRGASDPGSDASPGSRRSGPARRRSPGRSGERRSKGPTRRGERR